MNINNLNRLLQHNSMLGPFSKATGTKTGYADPSDKMSVAYRNRYAAVNEVKVNSQGVSGMLFNFDSTDTSAHQQIVDISDEGKQEIFDMVKSEFTREMGVHNGDTTRRTEVYTNYLKGIPEQDRAKASWTLDRLEAEYWSGFADEVKQTNPSWEPGQQFDPSVVQGLTRKSVSGPVDALSGKGFDLRV